MASGGNGGSVPGLSAKHTRQIEEGTKGLSAYFIRSRTRMAFPPPALQALISRSLKPR